MNKTILSGNEAIARGFYEAGGLFASAYPGTPSTEILENIGKYSEIQAQWAPNEKVALEVVGGAALGGVRVLSAMKHVGLNVAADPLFSLSYQGVNGGLVIVSADDPAMHSSQNEQDNRWYARAAKIPMLEPSDSQEAKDFTILALEISEKYDTPVLLRTTTRINHSKSIVTLNERVLPQQKDYVKDFAKNILLPANARKKHVLVEKRLEELAEYGTNCSCNIIELADKKMGIVASGVSYNYVKEILPNVSILKLGLTNPLPKKLIREFADQVERLFVIEELDPFLEEQIAAMGIKVEGKNRLPILGEFDQTIVAQAFNSDVPADKSVLDEVKIPPRPPVLCPGCSHRGVFYVMKKMKLTITGDIGCYTLGALPPLEAMDTCLCMGASVGYAEGLEKTAGDKLKGKIIGVIGDSTFYHSGITGLIDMVYNDSKAKLCILDNQITAMTGHQENPGSGLMLKNDPAKKVDIEALCRAAGVNKVVKVDPYNIEETLAVFKEVMALDEPAVIIADAPCVIKARIIFSKPYFVDAGKCTKCEICHRIGCPAIEKDEDGKAKINPLLCIGCDMCLQVCKPQAIQKPGE
ncbi:indolepyruvate ferredoxin oxidoreductase subunit alpha [candidate division KSB1 bacterium]|nr:indolepyruvate ferredoxin oxidoreductase subunit alpha [candidate division KSB1 bacterium]MBL7095626.1 indolepyruvate ferredoxin oxidoreductase subunit alpha [candidate division KSB1 bacterium]